MIITKGVYNQLLIHLEDFDFDGIEKVILTIKNEIYGKPVIIREYTTAEEIVETITPEEADGLFCCKTSGHGKSYYDFDAILSNGNRVKISTNGIINVTKGVGDIHDNESE